MRTPALPSICATSNATIAWRRSSGTGSVSTWIPAPGWVVDLQLISPTLSLGPYERIHLFQVVEQLPHPQWLALPGLPWARPYSVCPRLVHLLHRQ